VLERPDAYAAGGLTPRGQLADRDAGRGRFTRALDRLKEAWTATDSCAANPDTAQSGATVGDGISGAAYWTSWAFSPLGQRSTETDQHPEPGSNIRGPRNGFHKAGIAAARQYRLIAHSPAGAGRSPATLQRARQPGRGAPAAGPVAPGRRARRPTPARYHGISKEAAMTDMLIRDVPDNVIAAIDAHASRLGLSRSEYVRRRLAQDAVTGDSPVTAGDLERFARDFGDLADPDVMSRAWQ
jgi:hypothetical protein